MSWLAFSGLVVVALAVLYLPGLVVALCARLRWATALAAAPPISVALIATAAILADKVGMRWNLIPVLALTLLAAAGCLAAVLVGRATGRGRAAPAAALPVLGPADAASPTGKPGMAYPRRIPGWAWWIATAAGSIAVMCYHVMTFTGNPENFSQTYDNIFHLSAIRWILDYGDASSLTLRMTSGDGPPTFYPLAWHDTVSLVLIALRSGNVTAGNNAVVMAVAAFVWITGCLYLARTLVKCNTPAIIASGVLASAFSSFPYSPLAWGVLYPNFLGIALMPAGIALLADVFGLARGRRYSLWSSVPIALLCLLGAALAHPSTVALYCVLIVPMFVTWTIRTVRDGMRDGRPRVAATACVLCLLVFAAVVAIWIYLRPSPSTATWRPTRSTPQAIGEALSMSPDFSFVAWVSAIAVVVGAAILVRRRTGLWMLGAHLIMIWLWIVVASWPWGDLRTDIVGIWYNDPNRIAAALPITAFPLAVTGFAWAGEWLIRCVTAMDVRGHRLPTVVVEPVVAALTVAFMLLTTQTTTYLRTSVGTVAQTYTVPSDANVLDPDELALLRRLPSLVSPGSVVATAPYNGSSMAFALENVKTTTTHILYSPSAKVTIINLYLRDASDMPRVCQTLDTLDVRYVLDFGPKNEVNHSHLARQYPGFQHLSTAPGFTEIARDGHAVLYRIDACHTG